MGLTASRLNLGSLHSNGRRRSQQGEEQLYSYSLNKNYFSNYFLMGGERFEVNDPDYLFGDSSDLNFLTCTKPYSLPYKKAQQSLITNLNTKQKAINKVSSRVGSLSSPLNILSGRHRQVSQSRKQDSQTQPLNNSKGQSNRPEPSQPLVMLINIRKETLRLVKSSHACNLDSDQNSLTNTAPEQSPHQPFHSQKIHQTSGNKHFYSRMQKSNSTNRYSTTSSHATTIHPQDLGDGAGNENIELEQTVYGSKNYSDSDTSSVTSNTFSSRSTTTTSSTGKSGYTSVRDVPPSECASDDDGECFEDALNEPTNLSTENDSEKIQQKSLLTTAESTKEICDIKINMEGKDEVDRRSSCDIIRNHLPNTTRDKDSPATSSNATKTKSTKILTKVRNRKSPKNCTDGKLSTAEQQASNRVYNIEFTFDAEVDCSIRVSYFCTRVLSSNNVTYKPLHATYKSKTYTYKRGLNQKFEQQEHSFRPYLFDEDLLIYKPLDLDGNYNSGAVFPIVIHCVALEGPMPRQSHSLVATVEKSQLDESYSIKPLKQMIFVDGVQYILQDIYGIENKPMNSSSTSRRNPRLNRNLHSSCGSLYSLNNLRNSSMNLSDTASIASVLNAGNGASPGYSNRQGSIVSNQYRSLGSENTFECVICMSEERDTMLLPCRHMCLCSSCAQSLRYQSNACPICRCSFRAALNIRFTRRNSCSTDRKWSTNLNGDTEHKCLSANTTGAADASVTDENKHEEGARRESLTNSATPLLARSKFSTSAKESSTTTKPPVGAAVIPVESLLLNRADCVTIEGHDTRTNTDVEMGSISGSPGVRSDCGEPGQKGGPSEEERVSAADQARLDSNKSPPQDNS